MITLIKGCHIRKRNGLEVSLYAGVQPADLPADWVAQIPPDCLAPVETPPAAPPRPPVTLSPVPTKPGPSGGEEE